ncbi:MAG: polysaccharide biosynthesis C-terminal domain-containing protein [Bryobacteraceae bacterium]
MSQDGAGVRGVVRNTLWYSSELLFGVVAILLTSIPIARIIGPEKLGYFTLMQWWTNISGMVGSLGLPVATQKYMAEYLGRGDTAVASLIYRHTFRIQALVAAGIAAAGVLLAFWLTDPDYLASTILLVIALAPKMMTWIPSNANNAAERFSSNAAAGIAAGLLYVVIVAVSLWTGWDLTGIAAGMLLQNTVELALKMRSVRQWLPAAPPGRLPEDLRGRMFSFSGQSILLMIVNVVVWDRSDLVFLRMLDKDARQLSFYSLSFSLVERILLVPKSFSFVVGSRFMVQAGQESNRLYTEVSLGVRYVALFSLPVMVGMAAVSAPLTRTMYGTQYEAAIPVMLVAALLAVTKPFLLPARLLMQATEKQVFLIWWTCLSGVINVALDVLLIPAIPGSGALGAALANGLAQTLAIGGMWFKVGRTYPVELPWRFVSKVLASSLAMGLLVYLIVQLELPAPLLLAAGTAAGAALFPVLLRLTGALEPEDGQRLQKMSSMLPAPARPFYGKLLTYVTLADAMSASRR